VPSPAWQNRVFRYGLTLALIYFVIQAGAGWLALCFFALQSLVAFSSLEVTNYIEHYGLVRKEISPGIYERTLPKHSWNSGHRVSNWFLINLARHSDHHFIASKRYQVLTNVEDAAPQLPFGYGTMFLIALIPPLWFKLMNSRIVEWQHGNTGVKKSGVKNIDIMQYRPARALCLRFKVVNLLAIWLMTVLQKFGNAAR